MLHNHAVIHPQRRFLALACLVSWALGPVFGLGVVAHQLDHHELEESALSGLAEVALHGHLHQEDADDHNHHAAVPHSLMPSLLTGESQHGVITVTGAGKPSPPAECLQRYGPPPNPSSIGPPSPLSRLCILLL